ncbi:MAG TPA: phosphoribosylformylglycinamidine synthase subunit PurQ [Alphaproteobacteria bacterium]|nr:phosphoribosylformylglycinamidine synthase subunit PurQ [Alphaproteobacteria bacterium]
MKAAVVVFPGSNCDRDVAVALEAAMGHAPLMVWHRETELPPVDLIALPGGFSYGDYLRCGAVAAKSPIMRAVKAQVERGVRAIGICNGFQILTEAGLLPGALLRNASLKYACRTVSLKVERADTPFTAGYSAGQVVSFPIAHGEGNYTADAATLDRLEGEGLVAFRYTGAPGGSDASGNPNGSARDIAGIYNDRRTVLGMMPHPERAADPLHGGTDGQALFKSLVEALS